MRPEHRRNRMIQTLCIAIALGLMGACVDQLPPRPVPQPFANLVMLARDGGPTRLTSNIAELGNLNSGDTLRIRATDTDLLRVLVLLNDPDDATIGLVAGGGPAGAWFEQYVADPGRYVVFLQYTADRDQVPRNAQVEVASGSGTDTRPARQAVRVRFADGFLSAPGVWDELDGTQAERDLLVGLEPLVRDAILERLRIIFQNTPIDVLGPDDPEPAGPVSEVLYLPDRVESPDQTTRDSALPPPDPTRPQCQVRVTFGAQLPAGTLPDVGNRIPDDRAVVYVGSFQGRGTDCRTAALNSVSNLVLTLAQTGAHEIGHLVGFVHVEQVDLMNRTATLAFFRELGFARGQIQVQRVIAGEPVDEVFPSIVQDPAIYLASIFNMESSPKSEPRP
jgi:hypothetical protein